MLFQFVKMTASIMNALKRPDDQAEWRNILQLMYHMRQALACAMCGKLVSDPYTPVQESCHCLCSSCHDENAQMSYNCITCRHAQASQDGFKLNSDLNHTAVGFVKLCKLLYVKEMVPRWSNLTVTSRNGPITFAQLILEGKDADSIANENCLSESFKKTKVKQKRKPCRCGSGKNNNGRPGNLTCLGQRCTCYKEGKGCENCKCVGCKNPNGSSLNES
jgi:hypothetical protein